MNISLLSNVSTELGGAFSIERVVYSLEMTVLGLVAVFAVLAIIWGILALFKVFTYDIPNKKSNPDTEKKTEVVEEPAVLTETNDENEDDEATVAAIIAAISAYIASEQTSSDMPSGFRVVSFKRVRNKASWNSKNNY